MVEAALGVSVKRERACGEVGKGSHGHFRERKGRERVSVCVWLVTVKNGGSCQSIDKLVDKLLLYHCMGSHICL